MIDKSCITAIEDLFQVFGTLLTYQNAVYFPNAFIVFFMAMLCWVIKRDSISNLVILKYASKISRINTCLLELTKLLIILNNIGILIQAQCLEF